LNLLRFAPESTAFTFIATIAAATSTRRAGSNTASNCRARNASSRRAVRPYGRCIGKHRKRFGVPMHDKHRHMLARAPIQSFGRERRGSRDDDCAQAMFASAEKMLNAIGKPYRQRAATRLQGGSGHIQVEKTAIYRNGKGCCTSRQNSGAFGLTRGETAEFARRLAKAKPPRWAFSNGEGLVQELLKIEADASAIYWRKRYGFELSFKDEVPDSWRVFDTRTRYWRGGRLGEKPPQFSNRHALHPMNAMLNYSYQIAVGQMTRALAGLGFDPAFGFLHAEKPGRLSLSYDAIEPMRPHMDKIVFNYAATRVFERSDFVEVKEPRPHVRLGRKLAREVAALSLRKLPFVS